MITCWVEGDHSVKDVEEAHDGIRFTVRASGTEPKIKRKDGPS